jgi:Family of unknown function (DUF5995)
MLTATTVPEAIARMRLMEDSLPRSDGVADFVRLYREVTEGVWSAIDRGSFSDPRFLERLDVVFANLFFSAFEADQRERGSAPPAWRPLFEARVHRGIAPIQFALAGMNAHINRDLPLALVSVCDDLSIELRARSPEHADFLRVNALLSEVEQKVKERLLTGRLSLLDRILHRVHRLDDVLVMWNVERARDAAWANGETLWALRGSPDLASEFLVALDRMVGFAGRGLLIPSQSFLQAFARRLVRR